MTNCNVALTPGVGPEISLDPPADRMLDDQGKQRYQSIAGALMYLAQVSRYDILYAVNPMARTMSKPSKAHMGAAKHVLLYLAGSMNFPITYKRGGFHLTTYPDANWGGNLNNDKSTSSYIVIFANGPIIFKVRLRSLSGSIDYGGEARSSFHRDEGVTLLKKHGDGIRFHWGISERS